MRWKLLSLVGMLLLWPAVESAAGPTVAPRQKNTQFATRKNRGNRPPVTVWERMRDPKGWWQSRLARGTSRSASSRLRSFSSGAQPLSGGSITNPIFFIPPTFGSGGKGARNIEIGDFN